MEKESCGTKQILASDSFSSGRQFATAGANYARHSLARNSFANPVDALSSQD